MTRHTPTVWIGVHDLSLSGVPIVLERLLGAIDPADRERVHVVALKGGPMQQRLDGLAGTLTVLSPATGRSTSGALIAGARSVGLATAAEVAEQRFWRHAVRALPDPDVVVVHGAGAWPIMAMAPDVPVVLHLHELDTALDRSVPLSRRAEVFGRPSAVMVVSQPVATLAMRCGVPGDRVVEVPGVYDPAPPQDPAPAAAVLGEDGSWALGAGTPGWRKGTDRMTALAAALSRSDAPARVGWVGGAPAGVDAAWIEAEDPVRWFSACDDPWSLLAAASVIVVPSREDPLPLVAVEAGRHRRAVVATPSGGLVDLLDGGRGLVTDGHELRSLVEMTGRVLREPSFAEELGDALCEHVVRHHDPAVVAPTWWAIICGAAR